MVVTDIVAATAVIAVATAVILAAERAAVVADGGNRLKRLLEANLPSPAILNGRDDGKSQ